MAMQNYTRAFGREATESYIGDLVVCYSFHSAPYFVNFPWLVSRIGMMPALLRIDIQCHHRFL
jgi:hypothetical protein